MRNECVMPPRITHGLDFITSNQNKRTKYIANVKHSAQKLFSSLAGSQHRCVHCNFAQFTFFSTCDLRREEAFYRKWPTKNQRNTSTVRFTKCLRTLGEIDWNRRFFSKNLIYRFWFDQENITPNVIKFTCSYFNRIYRCPSDHHKMAARKKSFNRIWD